MLGPSERRSRVRRAVWLAWTGGRRLGRLHRRPGRAPLRPGSCAAHGPAARAWLVYLDRDGARHVAPGSQSRVDRRDGQRHGPFIAAAVRAQGVGGAAKVCLAASVFMMIFCVLRLGRYVAKVPHAVVSGFSCGVGAMMVILQLRTLLGLPAALSDASASPLRQLVQVLSNVSHTRWEPLLLGLIVIAGAIVAARRWPRSPAALLGVGMAVAAGYLLGWHERLLGDVALRLPPFAGFTWTPNDITDVLPPALGLAFVASVNILITSRVVEHFQGRHRPLRAADADGELGAYGIANLCAGVSGPR